MSEFSVIPKQDLRRLSVNDRKITSREFYNTFADHSVFLLLGVRRFSKNGVVDYEIFDWSYYDVLKRNGICPSLANMIDLHNYIIAGGL
ncbi:hypothetical protein [Streptococcus suis]